MATLITAYFDESGTHEGSEVVVVAGFVSGVSKWELFTREWKHCLDDWGIESFHMSDFESRHGPFKLWTKVEHKKRLNKLLALIHEHTLMSIGCGIPKESFDRIVSKEAKIICGDAYGLAAITCFRNLADIAKRPEVDGWLDCIMEQGAKGAGALLLIQQEESKSPEWMNNNRIISLDFRDRRLFPPLQAADILAYELYKHIPRNLRGDTRWPIRYPLVQLSAPLNEWHFVDDDELREVNRYLTDLWAATPHG